MNTPILTQIDLSKTIINKNNSREKTKWTATHPDIDLNKQYLIKFKQNDFFELSRFYNKIDLSTTIGKGITFTIYLSMDVDNLEVWKIN